MKNVDPTDVENVLKFIYLGVVDVPAAKLDTLTQFANDLGLKGEQIFTP